MSREWWLVWEDVPPGSTPGAWSVSWLPRGLRHVFAITHVGEGVWLIVNPHSTGLSVGHELAGETDVVDALVRRGRTLCRVPEMHDPSRPWLRGWMTCVSVAKYLCGIRDWWVLTPPQLLRACERRGWEIRRPC